MKKYEDKAIAVGILEDDYGAAWILVEQAAFTVDQVSPAETAAFIDSVFDTDPCINPESEESNEVELDESGNAEPPLTLAEFDEEVKKLNYSVCSYNGDNCSIQVNVHTSHDAETVLKIFGGDVVSGPIIITEEFDQTYSLDGESSIFTERRFTGTPSITMHGFVSAGNVEESFSNSVAYLGTSVSGSVRITGTITYAQYEVSIDSTEDTVMAVGFFEGMVDDTELETPPVDETIDDPQRFCSYGQDLNVTPDNVSCYKLVNYLTKCKCSGETVDRRTVEQSADCGDGDLFCPQNQSSCRKLIGSETYVEGYVDCDETTGDISDPEFYEQKCCHPPGMPLPKCAETTTIYRGGVGIKGGAQKYKDIYGDNTRIVPVGPKGPNCGTTTVRQQLAGLDCCEKATPVTFDEITSPSVMADYSSGIFYINGGLAPFTYMSGQAETHFLDDNGSKTQSITTKAGYITLHSEDICGTLFISVADACATEYTYTFRAVDGSWVLVESRRWSEQCYPGGTCYNDEDRSCSYDNPNGSGLPQDEFDPVHSVTVAEDGRSWTVQTIDGSLLFTEYGKIGLVRSDGEYSTNPVTLCGERLYTYDGYPNCLAIPAEVNPLSCDWYDTYSCNVNNGCALCSPDYYTYLDRYGVSVCGTRRTAVGYRIDRRTWHEWRC
jgi:hypothetical protein